MRSKTETTLVTLIILGSLGLATWAGYDFITNAHKTPSLSTVANYQPLADSQPNVEAPARVPVMAAGAGAAIAQETLPATERNLAIEIVDPIANEIDATAQVAREEMDGLRSELDTSQSRVASLEKEIEALNAQYQAEKLALEALIAESAETQLVLQDNKTALEQQVQDLTQSLDAERRQVGELQRRLAATRQPEQPTTQRATVDPTERLAQAQQAVDDGEFEQAEQLFKQLADAGNAQAQYKLANLYINGGIGRIELAEAHRLLDAAIASGFGPALATRQRLRETMTAEDLAELDAS